MQSGSIYRERHVSPNAADPSPPLLGKAALQLLTALLRRGVRVPVAVLAATVALALGLVTGLGELPFLFVGLVASWGLTTVVYLLWYSRFCNLNRKRTTLCPSCTSRLWRLCCARCGEPVPQLALWLRGLFLPRCPHCAMRLSTARHTLLAWCSTCRGGFTEPDRLYAKPTRVIVWITNSLPTCVGKDWSVAAPPGSNRVILHHRDDDSFACLLSFCASYQQDPLPTEEHLIPLTRLLLVSRDVEEVWSGRIQGFFGPKTLTESIAPLLDLEQRR